MSSLIGRHCEAAMVNHILASGVAIMTWVDIVTSALGMRICDSACTGRLAERIAPTKIAAATTGIGIAKSQISQARQSLGESVKA
jgi:2-polyprenyl-3-methyl-5-hydroxy-6-metoxy-1,4-benzoquinol methylase